ncbi:MAG: YihY/virulence factor BrkB family protein [Verrucomicrobiia bacterium]
MTVIDRTSPQQSAPLAKPGWIGQASLRLWTILGLAVKQFSRIDGAQWAGAFAYYAFFALFPSVVLLVTMTSAFIDRDRAGREVISYVESYIPISGTMQRQIFDSITGVVEARRQAGVIAVLMLIWVSTQAFTTLISATNRAWNTEAPNWWRLPLKSLVLLSIMTSALLLGLAVPVFARMANDWLFPVHGSRSWVYGLGSFSLPLLLVFISLSLFYKLAPRRPTRFAQVWPAALCTTVLLRVVESLFVIYLRDFATLNAVYGAFGGIMALLLWIYLSGCTFIFGACLAAAQAQVHPEAAVYRTVLGTKIRRGATKIRKMGGRGERRLAGGRKSNWGC